MEPRSMDSTLMSVLIAAVGNNTHSNQLKDSETKTGHGIHRVLAGNSRARVTSRDEQLHRSRVHLAMEDTLNSDSCTKERTFDVVAGSGKYM